MKRNFAIIGCGRIAQRHAEQIVRVGNLVAVCDNEISKANHLADQFKSKSYTSVEEMLKFEPSIEVVSVCSPNYLHKEHSIIALNAGKDVLCEKPLAIKKSDAEEMIVAAKRNNKKLFVVKQNRYNPPIEKLKSLLNENLLGAINSFQINCFWNRPDEYYNNSWKGKKDLDGGTLFTQFSHFIDLLYWTLGEVKSTQSINKNYLHKNIEIEDCGVVIFEMKSGTIGTMNYNVNTFQKNYEGSFTLFGERGTIKIGGQYLNTIEFQNIQGQNVILYETGNPANDYGYYQGSMSNHDKLYDHLMEAINNEEHNFPSAFDGMKTVEIIEMIYKSADKQSA